MKARKSSDPLAHSFQRVPGKYPFVVTQQRDQRAQWRVPVGRPWMQATIPGPSWDDESRRIA